MNSRAISYLISVLLFLTYNPVLTQENNYADSSHLSCEIEKANSISLFNMFREPSYLIFGSGLGNLGPMIFEGDIIPYFMINLSQNARWGMEVSPRIIIRMLNQHSYPVRTPSFMPKATIFYQLPNSRPDKHYYFTFVSWVHHSNGQDGNFYNPDNTTINTVTGNFTTYWIEGGLFLSRPTLAPILNNNYAKVYVAYNYMQQIELDGIYGRLRIFANVKNTVKLSGAFRRIVAPDKNSKTHVFDQSIKIGWIASDLYGISKIDMKRLIFKYTLSFKPTFFKDVNFFIHYYYGQDYYNIHFNHQLSVVRFGIASKSNILF